MIKKTMTLFAVSSITYAIKAQNLLKAQGYTCEVVKTPKDMGKGCGYSVKVGGNPIDAAQLMRGDGIEIKATRTLSE